MQQLTKEEREVLKEKYSDGYRFVARDGDGEIMCESCYEDECEIIFENKEG